MKTKYSWYETRDTSKAVRLVSLAVKTGSYVRHKTLVFGGKLVHQIQTEQNVLAVFVRNGE